MIRTGCRNPGSHPKPDGSEPLSAYADLQSEGVNSSDVDWYAAEFDRVAEQTLGGTAAG